LNPKSKHGSEDAAVERIIMSRKYKTYIGIEKSIGFQNANRYFELFGMEEKKSRNMS
jgi:hypothetical protein